MPDWLTRLLPEGWGATEFLVASIALTATTMVVSLISVALIVVRIPTDYFAGDTPPRLWSDRQPLVRWLLLIFKNLLGVTLVALGAVHRKTTRQDRPSNASAGSDFLIGSRTLRCIDTAPSIRTAVPIAAGRETAGHQIPTRRMAKVTLASPTADTDQGGSP